MFQNPSLRAIDIDVRIIDGWWNSQYLFQNPSLRAIDIDLLKLNGKHEQILFQNPSLRAIDIDRGDVPPLASNRQVSKPFVAGH